MTSTFQPDKTKLNLLVFDVESTDLHGTGFAVGAIVLNEEEKEIDRFELLSKEGAAQANAWVKENVLPNLQDMPTCEFDKDLRDAFWVFYSKHRDTSEIVADCCYPVETNFLNQVLHDDFVDRAWKMPYPLQDISSFIDVKTDRNKMSGIEGLRKHNPLDDSIASARCLFLLARFI